ncbi:ATP-binding protein [Polaromonas sp. CG_9.11]|uniref:ATP-binding protein n=1 Tax=Polaromonas sp. CG_9.11 TaxID=2787730 RepID=UPI0018CAF8C1|nr:signal transduction histidine kinase/CheY-like chemotaxis protein [Polaromonas sp. CG_9.11]
MPPACMDGLAGQALDLLPCVTLVVNADGTIVYASKPVTRLLGWRTSSLLGSPVFQLFTPIDQQKLNPLLRPPAAAPAEEPVAQDVAMWVLNKNLQLKKAKISVAHFEWQGQPHACLSLRFTLIEELELRLAREQVLEFKQASENKSRFLADMSHEIRTPLNGVLGMIDLLASSTLDAQQRAYLSSLKKSSRNLRALIKNVLDFSKIEAGMVETEQVPFDLVEILSAVVQAFTPLARAKGVALQLEHALAHTCYVGDPHRLSQVLNNLVSNALKFTLQGSVRVAVYAQMLLTDQDLWRLTISVTDTGMGIQPEQQARLFDSFHQASVSVSRHHGGSGLGLFISRELVELMGGELSVKSQPDKGSTFEFWLDLQPSHSPVASMETAPAARLEPLAGARILVVEDDLTNQTLLQAWLHQAEAVTVCRANGQEALEELSRERYFDAVLMDVSMPVMDGLTATRHIRQPQPQDSPARQRYLATLPVIGISGHAFSEDVARCLDAGMTDSLTKPLSRVAVLQKLTSLLEARQAGSAEF